VGIARQLSDSMRIADPSLSEEEAGKRFYLIDKYGLLKSSLGDKIRSEIEKYFIRQEDDWGSGETGLLEVVKKAKPTVLIGTSTNPGAFTEEIIREMSKHVDRPIIFPVSGLCEPLAVY
jgi:malate dehydrogenase (oxaloacetate-decarboxylating)